MRIPIELQNRVKEAYAGGLPWNELRLRFNLSTATIYRILNLQTGNTAQKIRDDFFQNGLSIQDIATKYDLAVKHVNATIESTIKGEM